MNFSHRLFSSATFWRYWCVLDNNLIILYETPGARPSFIIPLRASSQLRSLAMSSSSSKTGSGIVGEHVRQKGFAVFDSQVGSGLFFVATDSSDYDMWVKAISAALRNVELNVSEDMTLMNVQADSGIKQDSDELPTIAHQFVDPLQVCTASVSTQAFKSDRLGEDIPLKELAEPAGDGALEPHMYLDSDSMENLEMEEISLSCNEAGPKDLSTLNKNASNAEIPFNRPPSSAPRLPLQEPLPDFMEDAEMEEISLCCNEMGPNNFPALNENASSTESAPRLPLQEHLPIRERLALAKGKSKIATSKFGSALKSAKGGILAASEIGRDGVKQAMSKEVSRGDEPMKRSLAVGQTMSRLKLNANTKMTAALSSMQDQTSTTTGTLSEETVVPVVNSGSTKGEGAGNPKNVVGSKISLLKTVGSSIRSSTQDQLSKSSNHDDPPKPSGLSLKLSRDEVSGNYLSQDIRKKLINLDQSMSNTMRRLKIDEKVNQFSAAVKSGVMNDPVVRQISSASRSQPRSSDHSRHRFGVGDERQSMKPIKFDARETFSASSDLPLKIKSSILYGNALLVDDCLSDKVQSLRRVEGSWVVTVDPIKLVKDKPMIMDPTNNFEGESFPNPEKQPSFDSQDPCRWKYRIMATEVSDGSSVGVQASVERTTSEVLTFHTHISEMIANRLPATAGFNFQQVPIPACTDSSILQKLSPLDGLRISGQLLQKFLDVNSPPSNYAFVGGKYCKFNSLNARLLPHSLILSPSVLS
jgi:hypothetical protein